MAKIKFILRQYTSLIIKVLALVLLVSGFVKAVDPLGLAYKLEEYFDESVLNLPFLKAYSLGVAMLVILIETILGFMLLFRYRRRTTLIWVMVMMVFFGVLTFYSAYTGKVTDCGCFGDFIKLTPWQSFIKDLVLLGWAMIAWPYASNREGYIRKFFVLGATGIVFIMMLFSYFSLPLIDFRPYSIGTNIAEDREVPEGAPVDEYEIIWYYKVNDQTKAFTSQEKPWTIEGAKYVKRENKLVIKGVEPKIKDFFIYDIDGRECSEDLLHQIQPRVWVIIRGKEAKEDFQKKVALLEAENYDWLILTNLPLEQEFSQLAKGKVFFADEILLKTMIRAKLGYFLVSNGLIWNKTHSIDGIQGRFTIF